MDKKVFDIYKLPLVIAIVISIVLISVGTLRSFGDILGALVGATLGVIALDLEYVLYAYILEPAKDFSKTLVAFIAHKDFGNAIKYIDYHRDEIKEKALNSALFQIILAFLAIFVVSSTRIVFVEAFVLTMFAISIYKLIEIYYKQETDEWFWILKNKPHRQSVPLFILAMVAVLAYSIYIF